MVIHCLSRVVGDVDPYQSNKILSLGAYYFTIAKKKFHKGFGGRGGLLRKGPTKTKDKRGQPNETAVL